MTKVTIFVASLNSERTIERTIKSIAMQSYDNIETIFIDGGSDDNTLEIIQKSNLKNKTVLIEKVKGISRAWNRCLQEATGDIITILNSDDYYPVDIITSVVKEFEKFDINEPIVGYGNTNFVNRDNIVIGRKVCTNPNNFNLLFGFPFMHPSTYITKSTYELVGEFDVNKLVAMDTDWLIRAKNMGVKFLNVKSLVNMENEGQSFTRRFSGMGEFMDSLKMSGFSDPYLSLFILLRFFGLWYNIVKRSLFQRVHQNENP